MGSAASLARALRYAAQSVQRRSTQFTWLWSCFTLRHELRISSASIIFRKASSSPNSD